MTHEEAIQFWFTTMRPPESAHAAIRAKWKRLKATPEQIVASAKELDSISKAK